MLNGSGNDITPTSLGISSGDRTSYQYATAALLGLVTSVTGNYNYLVDGTALPVGAPVNRNFANTEGELYAQDSWRVKRNFTVSLGIRYGLMPPVHEVDGQQISTDQPIGAWFDKRGGLADQGLSSQGAGAISYVLPSSGRPLYPYHKNWQPRASFAYSPNGSSGISKFFFGGPGKTSIRAGFGTYYDEIGQPLASTINATAFGLASTLSTAANVYDSTQVPRFTGFNTLPTQLLPPAPKGGFPTTYPNIFAITNSIDDNLKAPYSMNLNFSIGREFGHGFFVQGSYVGRLSRHSLMQRDLAMPTNLRDPKSGQTYFQAMSQLATQLDFSGVSVANLQKIPFFENLWSTAAGGGFTATQAVAKDYLERSNPGDFTNVLNDMDNIQACGTTGSTFSAAGKITKLGCGVLGPNAMWSPQFSALSAWSSLGSGAYHSMQWTVRKRFSDGIQFDLNYTFSKSIDLASRSENSANFSSDFMINSWDPSQLRGVSRYDVRHSVNAFLVWQLAVRPRREVRPQHESRAGCFRGRLADRRHLPADFGPAVQHQRRFALGHQLGTELVRGAERPAGSGDGERAQYAGSGRRTESVARSEGRAGRLPGGTGRSDGQPQSRCAATASSISIAPFPRASRCPGRKSRSCRSAGKLTTSPTASASTRTRQRQPDDDLHFRQIERNSSARLGRWSSRCGSRSKINCENRGGGLSSSPPFSLIDSEFP